MAALSQRLSLEGRDEAIVFTAIFDKSCGGRPCDLEDMARYFDCAHLDIMEYIPAVRSLLARDMTFVCRAKEELPEMSDRVLLLSRM